MSDQGLENLSGFCFLRIASKLSALRRGAIILRQFAIRLQDTLYAKVSALLSDITRASLRNSHIRNFSGKGTCFESNYQSKLLPGKLTDLGPSFAFPPPECGPIQPWRLLESTARKPADPGRQHSLKCRDHCYLTSTRHCERYHQLGGCHCQHFLPHHRHHCRRS